MKDQDLALFEAFKKKLTYHENWGYGYPDFSGAAVLYEVEDEDIDEDFSILPGTGDRVAFNHRECGGVMGFCHENSEIREIEFNESSYFQERYPSEPQAPLDISTEFLWSRYLEISYLFWVLGTDEIHDTYVDFGYDSHAHLITEFEDEQECLDGDVYLCLYWLLVFGFLGDTSRYLLVMEKSQVEHPLIQECSAFFRHFSIGDDIDISYDNHSVQEREFFKTAFRKRHLNLLRFFKISHS